jgi:hypothetical protein
VLVVKYIDDDDETTNNDDDYAPELQIVEKKVDKIKWDNTSIKNATNTITNTNTNIRRPDTPMHINQGNQGDISSNTHHHHHHSETSHSSSVNNNMRTQNRSYHNNQSLNQSLVNSQDYIFFPPSKANAADINKVLLTYFVCLIFI